MKQTNDDHYSLDIYKTLVLIDDYDCSMALETFACGVLLAGAKVVPTSKILFKRIS